jgi:hypothetical protein
MTDKLTESWMREMYWEKDEEEFWSRAKNEFIKQNEMGRLQLLKAMNAWADQEDRPTREHASLLTKQRELEHWHHQLKALGR